MDRLWSWKELFVKWYVPYIYFTGSVYFQLLSFSARNSEKFLLLLFLIYQYEFKIPLLECLFAVKNEKFPFQQHYIKRHLNVFHFDALIMNDLLQFNWPFERLPHIGDWSSMKFKLFCYFSNFSVDNQDVNYTDLSFSLIANITCVGTRAIVVLKFKLHLLVLVRYINSFTN